MSKKFQVIVADPAWSFSDKLKMSDVPRGAEANYSLMSNKDIIALDVNSVADPDGCVLALWVPSSLLQVGLDTMKSWGFEQKQTYIWVKTKKNPLEGAGKLIRSIKNLPTKTDFKTFKLALASSVETINMDSVLSFFMGRLFRQTHEICLIGVNNNKIYKKLNNKSQRSVSLAENLKHSAKPDNLQNSLELMFPDTEKLEMFARRKKDGWTCVGNEICDGEDIRDSLKKFL